MVDPDHEIQALKQPKTSQKPGDSASFGALF